MLETEAIRNPTLCKLHEVSEGGLDQWDLILTAEMQQDQYRIITKGKRKVELYQNNNAISTYIYCGPFASLC